MTPDDHLVPLFRVKSGRTGETSVRGSAHGGTLRFAEDLATARRQCAQARAHGDPHAVVQFLDAAADMLQEVVTYWTDVPDGTDPFDR